MQTQNQNISGVLLPIFILAAIAYLLFHSVKAVHCLVFTVIQPNFWTTLHTTFPILALRHDCLHRERPAL